MTKVSLYFELFRGAALHRYPVAEWKRVFDFQQSHGRPRLEAWHGPSEYSYGVDGRVRKPGVVTRAVEHASKFAGVKLNSCLAVLYRDGSDSVAWHSDDECDMGSTVVSASFGATRRFSVRRKGQGRALANFDLGHGDLLVMRRGAQHLFEHCIRKTTKDVGPRVCLTFREIS